MTALQYALVGQRSGFRAMIQDMLCSREGYEHEVLDAINDVIGESDIWYTINELEDDYRALSPRQQTRVWKNVIYKLQQDSL